MSASRPGTVVPWGLASFPCANTIREAGHGSSDSLVWLTLKQKILPFIPVFDKWERKDGTVVAVAGMTQCVGELAADWVNSSGKRSLARSTLLKFPDFHPPQPCT